MIGLFSNYWIQSDMLWMTLSSLAVPRVSANLRTSIAGRTTGYTLAEFNVLLPAGRPAPAGYAASGQRKSECGPQHR